MLVVYMTWVLQEELSLGTARSMGFFGFLRDWTKVWPIWIGVLCSLKPSSSWVIESILITVPLF
jgi:hypothetical protein